MQVCGLFSIPGVVLEHVCIDSMHTADLGCFADAVGSLFHCEVNCKRLYRTAAEGLRALNTSLGHFYRANPGLSEVTPLSMSQLRSGEGGFPFLKAQQGFGVESVYL